MGLTKTLLAPSGASGSYWAIVNERIDRERSFSVVTLDCWISEQARKSAGFAPLTELRREVCLEGARYLDPSAPVPESSNRVKELYLKLVMPAPQIIEQRDPLTGEVLGSETVETNWFADAKSEV